MTEIRREIFGKMKWGKPGNVLRSVLNKGLYGGLVFQTVLFCAFSA
ncbi:MAG: hypothetical protein K2O16_14720 [Lachnospiraceae bacterium]|nr:hypothetical protein [Lachnospiraceae bacterium]